MRILIVDKNTRTRRYEANQLEFIDIEEEGGTLVFCGLKGKRKTGRYSLKDVMRIIIVE